MTFVERAELRRLCEAATPGPWEAYWTQHAEGMVVPSSMPYPSSRIAEVSSAPEDYGRANTLAIAACNPSAIIVLLDALDAAEHALHALPLTQALRAVMTETARADAAEAKLAAGDELVMAVKLSCSPKCVSATSWPCARCVRVKDALAAYAAVKP